MNNKRLERNVKLEALEPHAEALTPQQAEQVEGGGWSSDFCDPWDVKAPAPGNKLTIHAQKNQDIEVE